MQHLDLGVQYMKPCLRRGWTMWSPSPCLNKLAKSHGKFTTWNGLKEKFVLYNPNDYQRVDSSKLWFTWLNLIVGVEKVMNRLDKDMLSWKNTFFFHFHGGRLLKVFKKHTLSKNKPIIFFIF